MAFNRLDESRSSYHGVEIQKRGRSFFRRGESPLSSPLFRRKQFQNQRSDLSISGADSVASSRDSSLDRTSIPMSFHSLVERVRSSPKMTLKQRLQVMRSGSFSDVSRPSLEAKRKRWLVGRSESLRVGSQESPWSSPETDRRGSLPPTPSDLSYSPVRDRSMDRVHKLERRGILQHQPRSTPGSSSKDDSDPSRWKGFVNRSVSVRYWGFVYMFRSIVYNTSYHSLKQSHSHTLSWVWDWVSSSRGSEAPWLLSLDTRTASKMMIFLGNTAH